MNNIAGLPYFQASFDRNGKTSDILTLPQDTTDLFVISHGWNNNELEAQALYQELFQNYAALGGLSAKPAIVGVIWPSKAFDESVAVSGNASGATGSASLGGAVDEASMEEVRAKIRRMAQFFTTPSQLQALATAETLLPQLEESGTARTQFMNVIRSLLDPSAKNKEDASDAFFETDGNQLMKNLKVADTDLDEELAPEGGASMPAPGSKPPPEGGAAGIFTKILGGFQAAAMNALNFTTYYEMKRRAGVVGQNGVAPLLDQLSQRIDRIHLVGHSFGGRVVTAAAASSNTDKIRTMLLLQAAYSHNGLSRLKKGFFRSVLDNNRVKGPIVITHTKNDKAVGIAYPLASRISGDTACALGDENDEYGGMGRNGAQHMEPGERVKGNLLAINGSYSFTPATCFNLESSAFIKNHSDVRGPQVAHALRTASM